MHAEHAIVYSECPQGILKEHTLAYWNYTQSVL